MDATRIRGKYHSRTRLHYGLAVSAFQGDVHVETLEGSLVPVRLSLWLTPDQARSLAGALEAHAAEAEASQIEELHQENNSNATLPESV